MSSLRRQGSRDRSGAFRKCHPCVGRDPETEAERRTPSANLRVKIPPLGIPGLDHLQLPATLPRLDLLLTRDGGHGVIADFVPDQRLYAVLLGKAVDHALAMLPNAFRQIGRDAGV